MSTADYAHLTRKAFSDINSHPTASPLLNATTSNNNNNNSSSRSNSKPEAKSSGPSRHSFLTPPSITTSSSTPTKSSPHKLSTTDCSPSSPTTKRWNILSALSSLKRSSHFLSRTSTSSTPTTPSTTSLPTSSKHSYSRYSTKRSFTKSADSSLSSSEEGDEKSSRRKRKGVEKKEKKLKERGKETEGETESELDEERVGKRKRHSIKFREASDAVVGSLEDGVVNRKEDRKCRKDKTKGKGKGERVAPKKRVSFLLRRRGRFHLRSSHEKEKEKEKLSREYLVKAVDRSKNAEKDKVDGNRVKKGEVDEERGKNEDEVELSEERKRAQFRRALSLQEPLVDLDCENKRKGVNLGCVDDKDGTLRNSAPPPAAVEIKAKVDEQTLQKLQNFVRSTSMFSTADSDKADKIVRENSVRFERVASDGPRKNLLQRKDKGEDVVPAIDEFPDVEFVGSPTTAVGNFEDDDADDDQTPEGSDRGNNIIGEIRLEDFAEDESDYEFMDGQSFMSRENSFSEGLDNLKHDGSNLMLGGGGEHPQRLTWIGNEKELQAFFAEAGIMDEMEIEDVKIETGDFDVSDELEAEWAADAREHNMKCTMWTQEKNDGMSQEEQYGTGALDIRSLAKEFSQLQNFCGEDN